MIDHLYCEKKKRKKNCNEIWGWSDLQGALQLLNPISLCFLEGPEAGIGILLGKNPKKWPYEWGFLGFNLNNKACLVGYPLQHMSISPFINNITNNIQASFLVLPPPTNTIILLSSIVIVVAAAAAEDLWSKVDGLWWEILFLKREVKERRGWWIMSSFKTN